MDCPYEELETVPWAQVTTGRERRRMRRDGFCLPASVMLAVGCSLVQSHPNPRPARLLPILFEAVAFCFHLDLGQKGFMQRPWAFRAVAPPNANDGVTFMPFNGIWNSTGHWG